MLSTYKYVLCSYQHALGMYMYIPVFTSIPEWTLSPASQDFKEYGMMQTCWCQMSSNHQQIWTLTGVIPGWWFLIVNEVWVASVWVCTCTNKYVLSTYFVHTSMYCVCNNIAEDAVLCCMPVRNDTVCAWHVCCGAPTLNQCPYEDLTYMTLFW